MLLEIGRFFGVLSHDGDWLPSGKRIVVGDATPARVDLLAQLVRDIAHHAGHAINGHHSGIADVNTKEVAVDELNVIGRVQSVRDFCATY